MRKLLTWLSFFLSLVFAGYSQVSIADSLENVIKKMPDDTAKVNRLNDMVPKLQFVDPARARQNAEAAVELAQKINYPLGLAIGYRLIGVLYVDRNVLDSGKIWYDKAWPIVYDNPDKKFQRQAGQLKHNYGTIYHKKQVYDSATLNYTEAIKILTASGNDELLFFPNINLSTLYVYLKDPDKGLSYARGAYAAAKKMNDPSKIVMASNNVASMLLEMKRFDSVLAPLQQNLQLARESQNYYSEGITSNLLAQYYGNGKNNYDSAVYFVKNALAAITKVNNQYEMANMTQNVGYYYLRGGKYDSAHVYLKRAYDISRAQQLDMVTKYSLENLVDLEQLRNNIPAAYNYFKELYTFNDSLQQKLNANQVNELEIRFQTEKKEAQIKLQEAEIKQRKIQNYILAGSAAAILIILVLLYFNYRNRQKIQLQRINELETEKQLMATEAVLKGEEQERTRLAKDLHDGLGGMLSGIKYSLNTMKGNLVMTPENAQAFERSMDMLDSSIREMRRVAHNMMPEALVKFGLDTALKDFCTDINQSGALKVTYQSLGLTNTVIDQTTSITVYRIVQELINNTMKHAAAKSAIVQVSKDNDQLSITVEDDGKGFDTAILKQVKGIGWSNIQNRVEFLKGKLDVNSLPGKGTSVVIELSL